MAKAVEFRPSPVSAAEETKRRLDAAPAVHADAVLNAYRTLQTLHDTNTLDFVRGLLGAGDTVLTEVVSVATSPQSTRAIRNLLVLTDLLGQLDPDLLHRTTASVTTTLSAPQPAEPPSLWAIIKRLFSKDVRRALGTGVTVLEVIGRSLSASPLKAEH